jgi:hypothetical protein
VRWGGARMVCGLSTGDMDCLAEVRLFPGTMQIFTKRLRSGGEQHSRSKCRMSDTTVYGPSLVVLRVTQFGSQRFGFFGYHVELHKRHGQLQTPDLYV